jgi:hypothetical protein
MVLLAYGQILFPYMISCREKTGEANRIECAVRVAAMIKERLERTNIHV